MSPWVLDIELSKILAQWHAIPRNKWTHYECLFGSYTDLPSSLVVYVNNHQIVHTHFDTVTALAEILSL